MPYITAQPSPIQKPAGTPEANTRTKVSDFLRDNLPIALFTVHQAGRKAVEAFSEWSRGHQIDPAYARRLGATATAPDQMTADALAAFGELPVNVQDSHFAVAAAEEPSMSERVFCLTSEQTALANARVAELPPQQPGYTPSHTV